MIIYVDDANDEVPRFTQQQYNRLGLRETAGIGTSVIVVRATDPDTGESSLRSIKSTEQRVWSLMSVLVVQYQVEYILISLTGFKLPKSALQALARVSCLQVIKHDTGGCHSKGECKPHNRNVALTVHGM